MLTLVRSTPTDIQARFGPRVKAGQVRAAVHEAGHALVALRVGAPVTLVSIEPHGTHVARCEYVHAEPAFKEPAEARMLWALKQVAIAVAGPIAEGFVDYRLVDAATSATGDGDADDVRAAAAFGALRPAESAAAMERFARSWLEAAIFELDAVAAALVRNGTIRGVEVRRLAPRAYARVERGWGGFGAA